MPDFASVTAAPRLLGVLGAFARSSFLNMMAYRVRYLVGVANYFLYVSIWYYIMRAVKAADAAALPGFDSASDLVTYFAVAWAARAAYFNSLDNKIAQQVENGQLAMDLVRPISFVWMKYAETAGEVVFRVLFMSVPVLAVLAVVYHPLLAPPAGPGAALAAAASLAMAFHLYFAINFLTGLVSVLTLKIQGFLWAKFMLVQLLSGVMIPLVLFPAWARAFLVRSPFAGLGHTPVSIYQGRLAGAAAAEALAWQAGWTVLLLAACGIAWRGVARRVAIQGG